MSKRRKPFTPCPCRNKLNSAKKSTLNYMTCAAPGFGSRSSWAPSFLTLWSRSTPACSTMGILAAGIFNWLKIEIWFVAKLHLAEGPKAWLVAEFIWLGAQKRDRLPNGIWLNTHKRDWSPNCIWLNSSICDVVSREHVTTVWPHGFRWLIATPGKSKKINQSWAHELSFATWCGFWKPRHQSQGMGRINHGGRS